MRWLVLLASCFVCLAQAAQPAAAAAYFDQSGRDDVLAGCRPDGTRDRRRAGRVRLRHHPGRDDRRRQRCVRIHHGLTRQHARNAQRLLAFLDFNLRDARFLEQLDHFLDLPNIHA